MSQQRLILDGSANASQNGVDVEQKKNCRVLRNEATCASQNATHSTQEPAKRQNIETQKKQHITSY